MMTAQEIRKSYLNFFEKRGHKVIPRALLVPQDDPTTLFTGSGMQPMVPYLLGAKHPEGSRITDSQTCLRAQDIEEVGDNRHTTFFEMLGNWSLGDYFKAEQLPWCWEFLTEVVGLDPNKLYATCFIGDEKNNIPKDTESPEIWKKLFAEKGIEAQSADLGAEDEAAVRGVMPGERIFFYSGKPNWWCRNGKIDNMPAGEPGGPSSEVFYEFDFVQHDSKYGEHCHPNCDCGRFLEIGNNVFMEYVKTDKGFDRLPKKNVDYGGGLERIAAAAIDNPDVYAISLLQPIINALERISGKDYHSNTNSMRVIADHLRGATFLAVDGIVPSNKEQGYVMRRLLRRAIRFALELGIEQNFLQEIVPVIADIYNDDFPEVAENRDEIVGVLVKEEKAFRQTLRRGLNELDKMSQQKRVFTGADLFRLYDTYGFPVELSVEEVFERDIDLENDWRRSFKRQMAEQRSRSQTATKGIFKGGLVDHSDETKKLHTATHLMYEALRRVLGDHVVQRGSNVNAERTRFDFSHNEKMTPEQIAQVEKIVNEQIDKNLKVEWKEYPTNKAFKMGAKGAFGDKYGDRVKVYTMGNDGEKPFSIEICGGPHVDHTGQLSEGGKHFKIQKEESSSAGVRRIKAVLV